MFLKNPPSKNSGFFNCSLFGFTSERLFVSFHCFLVVLVVVVKVKIFKVGMRGSFRVQLKQRQILPGLPETYHPETGSRAHEKKACYVTQYRLNRDCYKRLSRRVYGRGKGFIPFPSKSAFYCVTDLSNCIHEKTERGGHVWLPRPVFYIILLELIIINSAIAFTRGISL